MTDELISKTDVIKIIKSVLSPASSLINVARARRQMLDRINELESKPEPQWIPVTERLPKEEDSIFARYYGTDRWRKSMFRKKSREVIVTSVFEDGELHTEVAHTTDGEWHVGVNVVPRTVIAWMPLPEPYKGVTE